MDDVARRAAIVEMSTTDACPVLVPWDSRADEIGTPARRGTLDGRVLPVVCPLLGRTVGDRPPRDRKTP